MTRAQTRCNTPGPDKFAGVRRHPPSATERPATYGVLRRNTLVSSVFRRPSVVSTEEWRRTAEDGDIILRVAFKLLGIRHIL